MRTMQSGRAFASLDALRGVAALSVVTLHLPILFGGKVLPGAYLAVDFFFVLSGFVLAYAYGDRLAGGMTTWTWMKARFIRLYPLYMLGTLIGLSVQILSVLLNGEWDRSVGIAASFAFATVFLPSLVSPVAAFPFVPAAWSLFFELVANAIYGPIARRGAWALTTALVVGGLLLIATAWIFGSLDVGAKLVTFAGGFGRVLFGFFAGVALYRLWDRARPSRSLPVWIGAIIVLVCFWVEPGAYRPVYDVVVAGLVLPGVIYFAAGYAGSPLTQRLGAYLGVASYPIYVLHQPLGGYIVGVLRRLGVDFEASAPLPGVVAVIALVAVGVVLDRMFDAPARRALTRLTSSRQTSIRATDAVASVHSPASVRPGSES